MLASTLARYRRRDRKCGAHALHRAYRLLGYDEDLDAIWSRIASPDRQGNWAAASYRLAADAQALGLNAITIKLKDPNALLEQFGSLADLQLIVCHRLKHGTRAGHYSLIHSAKKATVEVWNNISEIHAYERGHFLDLWTTNRPDDEFSARVVIALGPLHKQDKMVRHWIPNNTACLRCNQQIDLSLLQRLFPLSNNSELQRGWDAIFCSGCDAAHQ